MKREGTRGEVAELFPLVFGTIVVHSHVTCDKWFLTVIPALTCKLPDIKVRADKEYVSFYFVFWFHIEWDHDFLFWQ